MSRDFNILNYLKTKATWERLAIDYIPSPLLRDVDDSKLDHGKGSDPHCVNVADEGELFLKSLLDNSNNKLRMYGTVQELMENLKIYENLPVKYEQFEMIDKKYPEPFIYRSLKGNNFVSRKDVYSYFHYAVIMKYISNSKRQRVPFEIMEFLIDQEKRIAESFEFLPYTEPIFEQLYEELEKLMRDNEKETPLPHDVFAKYFENEIERDHDLEVLNEFINTHSESFTPYAETTEKNENTPVVVRIFEDGSEKFVMRSELLKSKEVRDSIEEVSKYVDEKEILFTIDLAQVFKTFRNEVKNIEFIRTPIKRTKHAAVPIVTPSGDRCILAVDVLLELLRRLISALNIFQKINKDNRTDTWKTVTEYMTMPENFFPFYMERKFFVSLTIFEQLKKITDEFWKKYEDEPAVPVRDIGKYGFAVEDLKDELNYLGLTDIFSEIIDYAEDVYSEVDRQKKRRFLRTCDMFDALEMCQLICILNRFPNLRMFLHTQKSCHRIPHLHCKLCSPAKFKNSAWKQYDYSDEEIIMIPHEEQEPKMTLKMKFADGLELGTNFYFLDKRLLKYEIKYFLLEGEKMKHVENALNSACPVIKANMTKAVISLENFSRYHNLKIYIRSVDLPYSNRVFTDEVLEMIPILLKQQNTPIGYSDCRLEKYRRKWKCDDKTLYNSIDMDEFKYVLEEFDINKNLITVVPDLVHRLTHYEMSIKADVSYISVYSPNGKMVMNNSQAIFYIFQSVVCGIKWSMDYCKTHSNCIKNLEKKIIDVMKEYENIGQNKYVSCEHVEENIKALKKHCTYKNQMKHVVFDHSLHQLNFNNEYPLTMYKEGVRSYDLPFYDVPEWKENETNESETHYRVWMARILFLLGWVERFFDDSDDVLLENSIRNSIILKIPSHFVHTAKDVIIRLLNIKIEEMMVLSEPMKQEPDLDAESILEYSKQQIVSNDSEKNTDLCSLAKKVESEIENGDGTTNGNEKNNYTFYEESDEKLKTLYESFIKVQMNEAARELIKDVTIWNKCLEDDTPTTQLSKKETYSRNTIGPETANSISLLGQLATVSEQTSNLANLLSKGTLNTLPNSETQVTSEGFDELNATSESGNVITVKLPSQPKKVTIPNRECQKCQNCSTEFMVKLEMITGDTCIELIIKSRRTDNGTKEYYLVNENTETFLTKDYCRTLLKRCMEKCPAQSKSLERVVKVIDDEIASESLNVGNEQGSSIDEKNEFLINLMEFNSNTPIRNQEDDLKKDINTAKSTVEKLSVPKESSSNTKETIVQKTHSNESKCCSKCLRTSERCNEAQRELKTTQNKLKMFEKKARDYDKLEKKLKETEKENEQLKTMNSKSTEKLELLKLKISKIDQIEEKLKLELKRTKNELTASENETKQIEKEFDEYKKNEEIHRKEREKMIKKMEKKVIELTESASIHSMQLEECQRNHQFMMDSVRVESNQKEEKLIEQIQQLETKMIRLKETAKKEENDEKQSFKKEISEKNTLINELKSTNSHLCLQIEEHEKTIQILLDRLSSTLSTLSNRPGTSSSSNRDTENPGEMRFQLVTLQKIKDTIRNGSALKHAKEMVEKLIAVTNRLEIQQFANYEFALFEGKIRNYLQAVELNIQKLKRTGDCIYIPPLSDHPSLSDRFMKEYWNEIDKQPSTSSETSSELADSECLICLANMEPSDETIKCENCRRRFHSECVSEWLKRKSVCPACSRGLLDPTEYPSLAS